MRSTELLLAAGLLAASAGLAQRLERTIFLPDSLGGLTAPIVAACNTRNNRIYVAGDQGDRMVAIDGATHERVGIVPVPVAVEPWEMVYAPGLDRLYCTGYEDEWLLVVDCERDSVVGFLEFDDCVAAVRPGPGGHKVYCHAWADDLGELVIIDGASNEVLSRLTIGDPILEYERYFLAVDPKHSKLYCPVDDTAGMFLRVVDCDRDSICAELELGLYFYGMDIDTVNGRLFCVSEDQAGMSIVVVDTRLDSIVNRIDLPSGSEGILDVRHNPRNGWFYCLIDDDYLIAADVSTGDVEQVWLGQEFVGWTLEVNPVSGTVYCADVEEGAVVVVDGSNHEVIARVEAFEPTDLCYNPANRLVYCTDYGADQVVAIDAEGKVVAEVPTAYDLRAVVLDEERGLLFCDNNSLDNLFVLDAATGRTVAEIEVAGSPDVLCLNRRHGKLYCSSTSDDLTVIDLATLTVKTRLVVGRDPENLLYDERADKLYVASARTDDLTVIDGRTDWRLATVPVGDEPCALCCDSVHGMIYCAAERSDSVAVIDTRTDSVVAVLGVGNKPVGLCYNTTAGKVYCANEADESITVIDGARRTVVATIPEIGDDPGRLECDPILNRLFCLTDDGVVLVDCAADSVITRFAIPGARDMVFDRSCNRLVVSDGARPYRILFIDPARCRVSGVVEGVYRPRQIALGETGDRFFVTSAAGRIYAVAKPCLDPVAVGESGPTFVGSMVTLYGRLPASLLDISGRRVADLAPGTNDLGRLPAGVYFIHRQGVPRNAKVIIAR